MDVNEIRRIRLQELIDQEGSIMAFAERVKTNADYISSILSEKTKRNLGDDLARRIEEVYKLPRGALDRSAGDELQDGIQSLPDEQAHEVLDFIRYKFERAEGVIASEKASHYTRMIDGMIKDMQRRKEETRQEGKHRLSEPRLIVPQAKTEKKKRRSK